MLAKIAATVDLAQQRLARGEPRPSARADVRVDRIRRLTRPGLPSMSPGQRAVTFDSGDVARRPSVSAAASLGRSSALAAIRYGRAIERPSDRPEVAAAGRPNMRSGASGAYETSVPLLILARTS